MGVGSVKGGGRGGPKGAGGAGAKGPVGKAGSMGKAEQTESLSGPTREVGSGEAVVEQAAQLAKALKSGEIKTKQEAAQKLVAAILKEKVDVKSNALSTRIAEHLQDDPRLAQTLERIWQKG